MPAFEASFAHDYEVSIDPELSSGDRIVEFPRAPPTGPKTILVRVHPREADAWIGRFWGGEFSSAAKTGVYSWPDPAVVCVVCGGAGWLVEAADPSKYHELEAKIVMDIVSLTDLGMTVVTDPWELYAYGADGLLWETGRIAIDGLRVIERKGSHLEGVVDSLEDVERPFSVDLATGKVVGGITL